MSRFASQMFTHQNLDREPRVADTLDVKEEHVRISFLLVDEPTRSILVGCDGDIADYRNSHIRMGFQTERNNRYTNEEHRNYTNYL